jgi:cystathionine gamma-synthase
MKIETRAVHAGRQIDPATGAVTPPIHLSTTFERNADGGYPRGFSYTREGNPNRQMLERCLASLEGGKEALCYSSGLAAVTAIVQGLEPGDHILAPDDVYYGVRKVVHEVFGKTGFEISYVDMSDLDAVRAAIRPSTRLVWVETPSNPLLKITDLAGVAEIARKANAISVCDGTFATPVLQRTFDHGVDIVMHSTTKYISGHSDVSGGVLITKYDSYLFERARNGQRYGGGVPSPFECWLTLRGVDTLPLRVRAQSANALAVAQFLQSHGSIERVYYPALSGHPNHAIAARQMCGGFGGMLSALVNGSEEDAMAVAARVKLFIRATSLGGPHSLIEHRASIEGPTSKTPRNLLRMSIGLEHVDDLIADLDQALTA